METTTLKTKKSGLSSGKKVNTTQKPIKQPKVILGGGNKYGWMSDTLFDEDLKGW